MKISFIAQDRIPQRKRRGPGPATERWANVIEYALGAKKAALLKELDVKPMSAYMMLRRIAKDRYAGKVAIMLRSGSIYVVPRAATI